MTIYEDLRAFLEEKDSDCFPTGITKGIRGMPFSSEVIYLTKLFKKSNHNFKNSKPLCKFYALEYIKECGSG